MYLNGLVVGGYMSRDNKKYLPSKAKASIYRRVKGSREPSLEQYWKGRLVNVLEIEVNRLKSLYDNGLTDLTDVARLIENLVIDNFSATVPDSVREHMKMLGESNLNNYIAQFYRMLKANKRLDLQRVKAIVLTIHFSK